MFQLIDVMMDWVNWFIGWPLIIYAVFMGALCTVAFSFIQVRSFFTAWKMILFPEKKAAAGEMTPLKAFINTLSTNLGNGSVVGGATAVVTGGPGAGIWVLAFGLLMMSVRFVEVYASTIYGAKAPKGTVLGGPMLYLREIAGGNVLAFIYALCCFVFGLIVANAMQTHSISYSIKTTWGIDPYISAVVMALFICYVVFGGAKRIIAVSDAIVPVKVVVFFGATAIIIGYHSGALVDAIKLMIKGAFTPEAIVGGVAGFTIMQAMMSGLNLSVTATESGLGTAAILFGYTGSSDGVRNGLMGMVSAFVSSLVCFIVTLCIVMSGMWDSGLQSSALTIGAFSTVFGVWGGYIVTFLSISFGIGVLVSYAYITRAAWLAVTGGAFEIFFAIMYCVAAFGGAVVDVHKMWMAVQIMNGVLLAINLFGLLMLMPRLVRNYYK